MYRRVVSQELVLLFPFRKQYYGGGPGDSKPYYDEALGSTVCVCMATTRCLIVIPVVFSSLFCSYQACKYAVQRQDDSSVCADQSFCSWEQVSSLERYSARCKYHVQILCRQCFGENPRTMLCVARISSTWRMSQHASYQNDALAVTRITCPRHH